MRDLPTSSRHSVPGKRDRYRISRDSRRN
jgi:hypothetical protein